MSADDADDTGAGILHVDMDAFYASVEVLDDPSLRGKPVIVGGIEGRGVVSSATYEARRYGVRSAMPVGQAMRLCPAAVVVPPHFDRYLALSDQVMDLFHEITPLVEPLSIDEAFLDVRGARRLWGPPGQVARMLRARVRERTGLTCSVGAAATKHVAKIASTMSKPDGLLIIAAADTEAFLQPLSVRALWGVGPKAGDVLAGRGIRTVADLVQTPRPVLERVLGAAMADRLWHLARGRDARAVETERVEKSVGHEETFQTDIADAQVLRAELRHLADRVGARLRQSGWEAATVSLKLRFSDFTTLTRTQTLPEPTAVGQRLGAAAIDLFDQVDRPLPVRLIGVRAERLRPAGSAGTALWDDDEEWRQVETALDDAAARFGEGAVRRAAVLGPRRDVGGVTHHPPPRRRPAD
ncbi:DNA polymerase IV [Microbacterium kribbense]|uniref:DNA polymerase IV n=1 Tax=Microbacterium kribbense TaxID=433645 RepID=A0ABP7GNV7_9MICO